MRGFYTVTMPSNDARLFELDVLKLTFSTALHRNLQLPSSYPVSAIVTFIERVSSPERPGRRLMQGATSSVTFGFLLLPAPELPTVLQLRARLAETATTVGIANDLAPVAANATGAIQIARSDATGVAQEPPKPLTREHAALRCCGVCSTAAKLAGMMRAAKRSAAIWLCCCTLQWTAP